MKIRVETSGLLTTIQDLGRYQYQKDGVVVSGAMDPLSFKIANLLVGNQIEEAALEITLIGPELYFYLDTIISICGAPFDATINGERVPLWRPILVKKESILKLGRCYSGCRAYIAVQGGIQTPFVLNSRSTYERGKLGGLHGEKLKKNDLLPIKEQDSKLSWDVYQSFFYTTRWFVNPTFYTNTNQEIRVIKGRQFHWFSDKAISTFLSTEYEISIDSDRMGYRLKGEKLAQIQKSELLSEATSFGTIQVPPDGQPIVLMADRQTTGGYPKIAVVISTDLPKLAQHKPGDRISFKIITLEQAQQLFLQHERLIHKLSARIKLFYTKQGES